MLYLVRKQGEAIIVNGNIRIEIEEIMKRRVRLAVQCPDKGSVYREELYIDMQNEADKK